MRRTRCLCEWWAGGVCCWAWVLGFLMSGAVLRRNMLASFGIIAVRSIVLRVASLGCITW